MKETLKEALRKLIKADYTRKAVLAKRAGFSTITEYKTELEKQIALEASKAEKKAKKVGKIPTGAKILVSTGAHKIIHYIDVLDRSGSMSDKIKAAAKGLAKAFKELQNTSDITYKYSLIECDTRPRVVYNRVDLDKVNISLLSNTRTGGSTPLHHSIIEAIELSREGENSCINTYTDGEDTDYKRYQSQCIKAIKGFAAKGNPVTFACTKQDAKLIMSTLGIDDSNILIHNNTSKGFEDVMKKTTKSRAFYASNVKAGNDVTLGFYKSVK